MISSGETGPPTAAPKKIARGQKAGLKLGQPFRYGDWA
jgi:hypothetical protein